MIGVVLTVMYGGSSAGKVIELKNEMNTNDKDGYELVWFDEFDRDGPPNPVNWNFEKGFVRNEENQWYQPDNAWCDNGFLIIEARKESKNNPTYVPGSSDWRTSREKIEFTAASLQTFGKHSWKYGRFVMRGKINISMGLWPAWWTLGVAGEWPSNGEIDMMEYYRNKLLFNIACGTNKQYTAHWFSNAIPVDSLGGQQWADQFHTWRMDWEEDAISLYLDDVLMNRVAMNQLANKDEKKLNPFKQPHYMLLNLALGGMNGGDLSNTDFPNRFEVDYVRVYQKK